MIVGVAHPATQVVGFYLPKNNIFAMIRPMKDKTIINKTGNARLDVFLASELKITRSQAQKMMVKS
jgi:hypothetical protein